MYILLYIYITIYTYIYIPTYSYTNNIYFKKMYSKYVGCKSRPFLRLMILLLSYCPLLKIGNNLQMSLVLRSLLCVAGNTFPWSVYFEIKILVPMLYSKLWNLIYI